jgi:hypothetical protein
MDDTDASLAAQLQGEENAEAARHAFVAAIHRDLQKALSVRAAAEAAPPRRPSHAAGAARPAPCPHTPAMRPPCTRPPATRSRPPARLPAQCEDPAALAQARDAVPIARLRAEARDTVELNRELGEHLELSEDDVLVQALLLWFKSSFFSWVVRPGPSCALGWCRGWAGDRASCSRLQQAAGSKRAAAGSCATPPPTDASPQGNTLPCDACGATAHASGMLQPLPAEAACGAGRVEGYTCEACGSVSRFPRYTDPKKLLVTRRGR